VSLLTYVCLVTIIGLISNGFSNPKGATRFIYKYTVKPVYVVTSIKQSPVLKGHPFLVISKKISHKLNLF